MGFAQRLGGSRPRGKLLSMGVEVRADRNCLPIVATTPVVIIPLALLFERERPTGRSIVGGIIRRARRGRPGYNSDCRKMKRTELHL